MATCEVMAGCDVRLQLECWQGEGGLLSFAHLSVGLMGKVSDYLGS